MQWSVNMADESKLPSQTVTVFAWSSKKPWSCVILMEDYVFSANFRCFFLSVAFSWSNWEKYLLQWIGFLEGAHKRGFSFNSTTYPSPSLDEGQPLVWLAVVHFACSMVSSLPFYCTVSTFNHPSQFVLKMECFH